MGGLVSSRSGYKLPGIIGYPLVVTVTGFAFAVLFAVGATFVFKYGLADRATLRRITADRWNDSEEIALHRSSPTTSTPSAR